MAITTIPPLNVPGTYFVIDPSGAITGSPALPNSVLYIGSRLSAGTVDALEIRQIITDTDAEAFFGVGSHIAQMIEKGRGTGPSGQVIKQWAISLDDAGGGAAAAGDITFTGTSTEAGTLGYMIGGREIRVGIPSGTAAAAVPALAVAADHTRLAATPTDGTGGVLDFDARNAGEIGNDIDIRMTEELPAGLSEVITGMTGGATNPLLTAAITAIKGLTVQRIVLGYSDTTSVDAIVAELVARESFIREQYGRAFVGLAGSSSSAIAYAAGYNSRFLTLMLSSLSPMPPWEVAAWLTMVDASISDPSGNRDHATGLGFVHPTITARLGFSDHEALIVGGVTPLVGDDFGDVMEVVRHVTTYKQNAGGFPDKTYQDATTSDTLWALTFTADFRLTTLYGDFKVADDPVSDIPGQSILTPNRLITALLLIYDDIWVANGWVEEAGRSAYQEALVAERNKSDVGRLDSFIRPNLTNSLHVIAIQVGFIL